MEIAVWILNGIPDTDFTNFIYSGANFNITQYYYCIIFSIK